MRPMVIAGLVNGVFGDPALYLDFRYAKRALLFDLGDIGALPPRKILRLSDVFVSHAHMDHFSGLDRLLRVCLGRGTLLRVYGPPGFIERVEHKLAACTWNLVGRYPGDFTILAHEVAPDWTVRRARFRSRNSFGPEALPDERNRLAEMGLAVGPWLKDLKRAVQEDMPDDSPIRAYWHDRDGRHERLLPLGELRARALQQVKGEKLCYATDLVYHAENEARKFHLTAEQAGRIARAARAKTVISIHFSPRYLGREAELRAELEQARAGP